LSVERNCEVCGAGAQDLLYTVNDFPIVRCRECRLVFVGRVVGEQELIDLYDADYWEGPEAVGYRGYATAEARKRHHFRSLLADVERLSPPPGDLVEIGSAYGFFLDEARRRGWRVRGVEPSGHAVRHAREVLGLDVRAGTFDEQPTEPGSADVVAMWDVIEHLPHPAQTVAKAAEWLRPGGLIAISTGDVESLSARLHGRDWSLMTPPWHQFYFSRRTLSRLLRGTGFRVVRTLGDGVLAADPGAASRRLPGWAERALCSRLVSGAARRLGLGGTMFVFARKGGA